jgi:hypothetical protein
MAKTFALNIWRIRQYDPTILGKIVELTNESYDPSVEKIWAHHCEKEKKDKLFPYVRYQCYSEILIIEEKRVYGRVF